MKRPMALIGFTYAITLILLETLPDNYKLSAVIVSISLLIINLLIPILRKNRRLLVFISTCTLASSICFINYKINIEPTLKYADKPAKIECVIDDLPYNKNNHLYYHAKVESVNGENVHPFYTVISTKEPLECDLDDRLFCNVHFYLPQSSYFFDSKNYYRSKKIHIKALFDMQSETQAQSPEFHSLKYYILNLKSKMLSIPKMFFSDELVNVQNGIFLGEKANINNTLKNVMLKNGVYHLIATSGVHISIIMSLFLWLFKKLRFSHKTAHILTALPILLFIALTGFTESATRAGITCAIYLLGMILLKSPDSLNSLGLATFLICLFSPDAALSLGLWLSVLSVLGIILFSKNISSFIHSLFSGKFEKHKIVRALVTSISVSIAVNILTAPITIMYSKIFSIIQPISNLFILPLTSIILTLTLLPALLGVMQFPKLILYPIAFINGGVTKIMLTLLHGFADLPFSYISLDYPFLKLWIGLIIVIFAVCSLLFVRPRSTVLSMLISVDTLLCGILSYQILNYNSANISFINCDYGVACVIRKNSHTACITYFGENNYTNNLENFLECNNIDNIDYFAVTHSDFYPDDFMENIKRHHNIDSLILPNDVDNYVIKNSDSDTMFFTDNVTSTLWNGDLKIEIFKHDEQSYTKIIIDNLSILIIPDNGNCDDLSDNCKNFNIIATSGIPKNFDKLKTDSIILYGPQKTIYESIDKIPPNIKRYNLAYYTKLNVVHKNKNYKIGV